MYNYKFLYPSGRSMCELSSEFPLTFNKGDEIKIMKDGDMRTFTVSHTRYYLEYYAWDNTIYIILED